MPALGMAQDTGKLIAWLKLEGEQVRQGEIIMEIETDKATVEIEAPVSGILSGISAEAGEDVPVGETIAWILSPGESLPGEELITAISENVESPVEALSATPLARKIADEYHIDLNTIKSDGKRIHKKDVLTFLEAQSLQGEGTRLYPASPKARRMAAEQGLDLKDIQGSGPQGAILASDILASSAEVEVIPYLSRPPVKQVESFEVSTIWERMAERVTQSWTSAPHFYLQRETNASRLMAWRESAQRSTQQRLTYTDLLVRLVAAALTQYPRLIAHWESGRIVSSEEINIGLAMAVEDGLVVPVIHAAEKLSLLQLAQRRQELMERARSGKLRLDDLQGGTFTISNLGMYGVDVFNAIVNPPQAALLAVGRIADRVVPQNGQPAVLPMMTMSLSCDHRVVDGARGAQFLQTLAELIEEPLALLE